MTEHAPDILPALVAASSAWVAVVYFIIGALVVPNLEFPPRATVFAIGFFVLCALTHVHIAHGASSGAFPAVAENWLMLLNHIGQGICGSGFVKVAISKKLTIRMEA